MRLERVDVQIDLVFLKVMMRLGRSLAGETGMVNRMARWSETARSKHCRWAGGEPEEQTRSRV